MSTESFRELPLEDFGGLVTLYDPADVPPDQSPDNQNVEYFPGGLRTRPGTVSAFTAISATPKINGLKSFVTITLLQRLLVYTSDGRLYKESPPGTLTQITVNLRTGFYLKSTTLFGAEWMGFSDGKLGKDIPRQYDDTNIDRVSQVGPGEGPTVADEPVATIEAPATGAVRAANVVTITTTAAHGLVVGLTVVIAGVTDATFNGTFTIATVPTSTSFTYAQVAGNATSGNGTATITGAVSAGVHKFVVFFETRTGYWTRPSPPVSFTAAGTKRISLSAIPTGPANVVRRRVAATLKDGARYYHLSASMVLEDNTSTTLRFDFTDSQLASGTNVQALFDLEVLGPAAVPFAFASRLFWLGEENAIQDFRNLSFDGGFSSGRPLGWTAGANFAGGGQETSDVIFGHAYKITGDGAAATRGEITQAAVLDAWNAVKVLIQLNVAYTVRARVKRTAGLVAGRLNIDLSGTGVDTTGLQLTAAQVTETWTEYEASLTAALASVPSDLVLRIFADQTPTNNESFLIDEVRIVRTAEPALLSTVRVSNLEEPEEYDGTKGLINVAENNGQALRALYELRDFLYLVKERSIFVTSDDGQNEPNGWIVQPVSSTVGTPSPWGVGLGEDFAVIASRDGAYMTRGGVISPENCVSEEIRPTWERINWEGAGEKVWVVVDVKRKRVKIGVPLDGATQPSHVLVVDYTLGWGEERKWTIWTLAANSAAIVESASGPRVFLGNNAANGKVYKLDDDATEDDGVAIDGYWKSGPFSADGAGLLFGYLRLFAEGAGALKLKAYRPSDTSLVELLDLALTDKPSRYQERMLDITASELAFRVGTNAVGAWFEISMLAPYVKSDPWTS